MSFSLLFVAGLVNAATSGNLKPARATEKTFADNDSQYVQWNVDTSYKYNISDADQDNFYVNEDDSSEGDSSEVQQN